MKRIFTLCVATLAMASILLLTPSCKKDGNGAENPAPNKEYFGDYEATLLLQKPFTFKIKAGGSAKQAILVDEQGTTSATIEVIAEYEAAHIILFNIVSAGSINNEKLEPGQKIFSLDGKNGNAQYVSGQFSASVKLGGDASLFTASKK